MKKILIGFALLLALVPAQSALANSLDGTKWDLLMKIYSGTNDWESAWNEAMLRFSGDQALWADENGAVTGTYTVSGDDIVLNIFGGSYAAEIEEVDDEIHLTVIDREGFDWNFTPAYDASGGSVSPGGDRFTGTEWTILSKQLIKTHEWTDDNNDEILSFTRDQVTWKDKNGTVTGTYTVFGDGMIIMNIFGGSYFAEIELIDGGEFLDLYFLDGYKWTFTPPYEPSGGIDDPGDGESGDSDGAGDWLGDNWYWLAAIAVVAIGLFLYTQRKGKPAPPAAQPTGYGAAPNMAPTQYGAVHAAVSLVCVRGALQGASYPVNGVVHIGRDPRQCQIVFPSDANGVSSLHCEVQPQPYGVMLTDKGSTYGTFVNGRRLNAHESVTLNRGDSFCLADANNTFSVR